VQAGQILDCYTSIERAFIYFAVIFVRLYPLAVKLHAGYLLLVLPWQKKFTLLIVLIEVLRMFWDDALWMSGGAIMVFGTYVAIVMAMLGVALWRSGDAEEEVVHVPIRYHPKYTQHLWDLPSPRQPQNVLPPQQSLPQYGQPRHYLPQHVAP